MVTEEKLETVCCMCQKLFLALHFNCNANTVALHKQPSRQTPQNFQVVSQQEIWPITMYLFSTRESELEKKGADDKVEGVMFY